MIRRPALLNKDLEIPGVTGEVTGDGRERPNNCGVNRGIAGRTERFIGILGIEN
jgi:hypothetical protein